MKTIWLSKSTRERGKIPRVPLGMTVSVVSNPFDALGVKYVRNLFLVLFSGE